MKKPIMSDSEWFEFVSNNKIKHMQFDELQAVLPDLELPNDSRERRESVFCPMFRKYICLGCCMDFTYVTEFDSEWSFCTPQLKELYQEILDDKGFDYVQDMCGVCRQCMVEYETNYQGADTVLRELNVNGDEPMKIKRIRRLSGNFLIKQQRRLIVESGLRPRLGRCARISKINRRYKKIGNRKMRNLPVDIDKLPNSYHKKVFHNMWRDW